MSSTRPGRDGGLPRADGRTMTYRRLGHGAPVVCLAGGPGADAEYLEDLGGLDARFELLIPDMRGTGGSAPAASDAGYAFDRLADDVEAFRDHLRLGRLSLLAHSAACTTALVYGARHPDRLRSLILVAPSRILLDDVADDTAEILGLRAGEVWHPAVTAAQARLAEGPGKDEALELLAALAPASYAGWGEREREHAASMQPASWDATRFFWQSDVDGDDVRARLGGVEAPVLVLTGGLDASVGVNAGAAWAECFSHARHENIAESAHIPWVDAPQVFARLVSAFLVHSSSA